MKSPLIGKLVTVRHAGSTDRARVETILNTQGRSGELCDDDELVVAAEYNQIIGFGILKKEGDSGCVSLFENSGRKGIGNSILRHLTEHSAVSNLYAARYACYFSESGLGGPGRARRGPACRPRLLQRLPLGASA